MNDHVSVLLKWCIIMFSLLVFSVYAEASEYVIKFQEGVYEFDPSKKFDSLNNKYLSRVTIKKDGNHLVEVKGSTLPDSAAFYQLWHNSQIIKSPSDNDVFNLYEDAKNQQSNIDFLKNAALIPEEFLSFMYEHVTYTPVLYSGLYKFTIGLHKNKITETRPYVPRLMGTNSGLPFSGKNGYQQQDWRSKVQTGGFIKTITYNKTHGDYKANGINIHNGRWSGSHRDSAGCLTIDPRDWENFLNMLPDIDSWSEGKHEGYVVVVRKGEENLECGITNNCSSIGPPSPPGGLRIKAQ